MGGQCIIYFKQIEYCCRECNTRRSLSTTGRCMRCIFRWWFTLTVFMLPCVYRVSDLFALTSICQTAWHITQDEFLADWWWSVIYRRNIDQLILASSSCQSKSSCLISSFVAIIKTGNPNWVTKVMILWWQPVPCMEKRRTWGWGS